MLRAHFAGRSWLWLLPMFHLAACGSEAWAVSSDVHDEVDTPVALDAGSVGLGSVVPGSADAGSQATGGSAQSSWRLPAQTVCGDREFTFEPAPRIAPDWSKGALVPITGRANRFGYGHEEYLAHVRRGRQHAAVYPVTVTESWLPLDLIDRTLTLDGAEVLPLLGAVRPTAVFPTLDGFEDWLGLARYPDCDAGGAQSVPFPDGQRPTYRMGSTRVSSDDGAQLTYGCAGCHASKLFGRSILGLQARASRANVAIDGARVALGAVPIELLRVVVSMSEGEARVLTRLQQALRYVEGKAPLVRGLDTSVAQVALSLAKRAVDPYATRDPALTQARPDPLATVPADSKPGNWWVLKYKNRWLSDGSIVSGNPIITNLLWNEIGRGTDLHQLEAWLDANQEVIADMTAAVFAAEPVRITEFFPAESIDIEAARRGKALFDGRCASCHGSYAKGWELPHAATLPLADRLATVEVRYHEDTPVHDVGTDPLRSQGMRSLVQLNELAIYKKSGTRVEVQTGYVPPPLVGIWARFPYFHNNSAPSLCAVLTRGSERPSTYYGGEQQDPATDFDRECNGYPSGEKVPTSWLNDGDALYDTKRQGLGNQGHDEGVFLENGAELFTPAQKRDLITFLQTL